MSDDAQKKKPLNGRLGSLQTLVNRVYRARVQSEWASSLDIFRGRFNANEGGTAREYLDLADVFAAQASAFVRSGLFSGDTLERVGEALGENISRTDEMADVLLSEEQLVPLKPDDTKLLVDIVRTNARIRDVEVECRSVMKYGQPGTCLR
jgi:hypothetical protein